MIEYVPDEALPDREAILARLDSHDREPLLRILTLLCPCRNECYDVEIWSKMRAIGTMQWDFEVREAAGHPLGTLQERARVHRRSRRLLDELAKTWLGDKAYPEWFRRELRKGIPAGDIEYPKAGVRDVPTLVELLASGDEDSIRDALDALCPADGRHLSKKVWHAIVRSQRSPREYVRRKAVAAAAALRAHQTTCHVRHA